MVIIKYLCERPARDVYIHTTLTFPSGVWVTTFEFATKFENENAARRFLIDYKYNLLWVQVIFIDCGDI